jgi:two-component system sensor histidine kinase KdpD
VNRQAGRGWQKHLALALECVASVAVVTGLAVAVDALAPASGLGLIYLVAVAFVAMRHGERAAFATALLAAIAFKFFFLEPRYGPGIDDFATVVLLLTLVVASIIIGRFAERMRRQAVEAREAAQLATAKERENAMVATAASALLEGADVRTGRADARIELVAAPSPRRGEIAVRLPTSSRPAWLYVPEEGPSDMEAHAGVATVLARLVDVAQERQRLDAQATEAEATKRAEVAKTAILHAISHDLRSPLTAIILASDTLLRGPLEPPLQAEVGAVIDTQAKRLARLIDDLLDMSRIDAGAVDPQTDWCDLREIVARAAASLEPEHPVEVLVDPLPLVRADPAQLERVFVNLLANASRFSTAGRPVRVTGNVAGGRVQVRVTNEGPTIPRATRLRIFEPFAATRGPARGVGLGLAICRGFVEANGGRIALQSGNGETSFTVSFPLAPQRVPA